MTLQLTNTEKAAIKAVMVGEMRKMARSLLDGSVDVEKADTIDEDTDFFTMDMKWYKNVIRLCQHLYDSDLCSYDVNQFWRNDSIVRDYVWETLGENLYTDLYEKIETYITSRKMKNRRVVETKSLFST